ncbi:MAG TPA: DUF4911 domain-containing protein [Methylomusa anaerophila]|uniref:DUF4911 domain-containing protein n=1 Tax=Methylomusa anaerophila TaxID=1930071 RepID=A0A348APA2_9FIRM|nr:DUF4911 domain-containing protein [Methylomusa anaerophila]BBB92900.1 hypothetical protein MAMMFC1_03608 [Methylomusa anaerophila]HML87264.1 DUF4911 domain-containing protein [Methylomusa anaerophila]
MKQFDCSIMIRVEPRDVNFVNQIMEGYEYLGVVSTINRAEGILVVRVTPDTVNDVRRILSTLPINVKDVKDVKDIK